MINNKNREIYNHVYTEKNVSLDNVKNPYRRWFIDYYFSIIEKYGTGKDVLDLCCGSGALLIPKLEIIKSAIGVDFSSMMLNAFKKNLTNNHSEKVKLVLGDANYLPLKNELVDFVYSITSLYHIPDVHNAIRETWRVLRPGGIAALELGNSYSLNTIITDAYHKEQNWAQSFHIPYGCMGQYLQESGFQILEHRSFQLIPSYGVPRRLFFLRPLAGKYLQRILQIKIDNKLIDEHISSIWPLRYFAFRHIFICKKNTR